MAQSMIDFSRQNGRLPVWNMWASETDMMIGYHSAPVIADAILKGIGNIDAQAALDECVRTARLDSYRSRATTAPSALSRPTEIRRGPCQRPSNMPTMTIA